jgi:hypothetical protein
VNEFSRVGKPFFSVCTFEGVGDLNGTIFNYWGVAEGVNDSVEAGAVVAFAGGVVVVEFEGEANDLLARRLSEEIRLG